MKVRLKVDMTVEAENLAEGKKKLIGILQLSDEEADLIGDGDGWACGDADHWGMVMMCW